MWLPIYINVAVLSVLVNARVASRSLNRGHVCGVMHEAATQFDGEKVIMRFNDGLKWDTEAVLMEYTTVFHGSLFSSGSHCNTKVVLVTYTEVSYVSSSILTITLNPLV